MNIVRVIDGAKVSDHHALLPTMEVCAEVLAALPAGERNVLMLVMVRLLCAVGESQQAEDSTVTLDCGGAAFTAKGRVVTRPGWKAVEQAYLATLRQNRSRRRNRLPGCRRFRRGRPCRCALPP